MKQDNYIKLNIKLILVLIFIFMSVSLPLGYFSNVNSNRQKAKFYEVTSILSSQNSQEILSTAQKIVALNKQYGSITNADKVEGDTAVEVIKQLQVEKDKLELLKDEYTKVLQPKGLGLNSATFYIYNGKVSTIEYNGIISNGRYDVEAIINNAITYWIKNEKSLDEVNKILNEDEDSYLVRSMVEVGKIDKDTTLFLITQINRK